MTLKDFIPFAGEQKIVDRLDKLQGRTLTYPVLISIGFSKIVEKLVLYPEIDEQLLVRWVGFTVSIIGMYFVSDEKQKNREKSKSKPKSKPKSNSDTDTDTDKSTSENG